MEMMRNAELVALDLADWRKLGQGLHARYRVGDFAGGLRFLSAVGEAAAEVGHQPRVSLAEGYVELRLASVDAVVRDRTGGERVVEGVTGRDVALARRITELAAGQGLLADPASLTTVELALDTADAARLSPFWAALLHGGSSSPGQLGFGHDVRDPLGRVPLLWFQDTDEHETPRQRFHLDVWVAPEVAGSRIDAAVAAGGTVVDDSQAPSFTVLADADGNRACVCTFLEPAST